MILKIIFIFYFLLPLLTKAEKFRGYVQGDYQKNSLLFNKRSQKIATNNDKKIIWENDNFLSEDRKLKWMEEDEQVIDNLQSEFIKNKNNLRELHIKAFDRSVSVNYLPYPEISHYVPNGFVESDQKLITAAFRAISKLRFCESPNFDTKCADGFLNISLNTFNTDKFSFNTKLSIQSISDRGSTSIGEESSMGFKLAKRLSPKWSMAFGGENVIHLDKNIDMGRNFYLIASTFYEIPSSNSDNPSIVFANFGVGTDFYGYAGNGFLGTTSCFGKPTLTGNGTNNCNIGPIGSIAYAFNDRFSLINEWFGYGYGTGFSIKPYKEVPLVFSIYATDYIKGFPKYAAEHCPNNNCDPRFYGNISLSF